MKEKAIVTVITVLAVMLSSIIINENVIKTRNNESTDFINPSVSEAQGVTDEQNKCN